MEHDANQKPLTVYYDGTCALCSLEIGYYEGRIGADRIDFVNIATAPMPEDLTRHAAMARFHVRRSDGSLLSGARAFIAVWDSLPKWRWAARLAHLPGAARAMEGAYRVFLNLRPGLSRLARRLGATPRTRV
jgi:predicted DCC family thiol-disulfide oxidoreductase YuxK